MGIRINVGLPGPFSVSAPLVPSTKPLQRALRQAGRSSGSGCSRPCCARPAQRPYIPRGETLTASEAARLRARRSPEQESAVGAWVFVMLTLIALVTMLASCG